MTAVVTGASGHLGACLVRELLGRGIPVRALVHHNTAPLEGLDVDPVHGDVRDEAALRRAFAGAEIVYHLAAVISIAGDRGGLVPAVNVGGAEAAASAALAEGVRRLVLCSSIHAFDLSACGPVLNETASRVPQQGGRHSAYDRSKADGERRVRVLLGRGLDAVIVHPTSVIGPYDYEPSLMGGVFLRLYRRRLPGLVAGGFDFVDVRDVAAGLVAAAERGRSGESYLLGGRFTTVRELAEVAAEITGSRPPRFTFPMRLARIGAPFLGLWARMTGGRAIYTGESLGILEGAPEVDTTKAEHDLGFTARPIEETVRDLYEWFAAEGRIPTMRADGGAA
jgi:dihydroflavonol-4-reductase